MQYIASFAQKPYFFEISPSAYTREINKVALIGSRTT